VELDLLNPIIWLVEEQEEEEVAIVVVKTNILSLVEAVNVKYIKYIKKV
jgi:hypothetical protein